MVKLLEQCLDDDEYTRCGFRDFSIMRDRDIHAFSPKPATRRFPKGVVIDVHGRSSSLVPTSAVLRSDLCTPDLDQRGKMNPG